MSVGEGVVKQKQEEGVEQSKEQSSVVAEPSWAAIAGQREKSALCVQTCVFVCIYRAKALRQ